MRGNKNLLLNHLTKSENSNINKNKIFISLNTNDQNLLYPTMKTINNISRNHENKMINYKYKTKKEIKYFLSESNNILRNRLLSKKIQKYNSNENIKSRILLKENGEEDYSTIMKHLEKWDKDHCFSNKNSKNVSLLHNNLINYYKNNNLINEEKNLYAIDNMLKAKAGFLQLLNKGYLNNQNRLLKELFMRSPTEIKKINENKEEKKINENKVNKNDEDVFIKLLNKKKEDKKNNDFYPNKIYKEKIKYEKELHQKLLFINNLLFNKKYIKDEKKKLLDKIYEEKNKLIIDYNDKFSKDIKQYWIRYDEFDYSYKRKIKLLSPDVKKEKLDRRKSLAFNTKNSLSIQLKNMENLKNNKITSLNMEMFIKQKKLKSEYVEKIKKFNKEKDVLENEIEIINNELSYYKCVNDELLREYKSYYMDILKKGIDIRKDGLLWVVKNLIELQINLEYQHFPKYLTHEQIDYLKKLAFIILEENELKIIISVLKKRQSNEIINDNIERMNLVDNLMIDKKDGNKNDNKDENNIIIKKFYKIYKNNQKALKFLDKNEEDIKIKNILIQIKKGLYSIEQKNKNFIKENQNSILNAFMGKANDKDLFSLILIIRKRLMDLDVIKKNIIKKEKENYLDSMKFIGNSSYIDKMLVKDLIKKALFGFAQFEKK